MLNLLAIYYYQFQSHNACIQLEQCYNVLEQMIKAWLDLYQKYIAVHGCLS